MDLGGGYFSSDPKVNALMWNWNKIFLIYCDGASFAGDNATVAVVKACDHFRIFLLFCVSLF
jgi:hypothetical protein